MTPPSTQPPPEMPTTLTGRVTQGVRELNPGYFALVMATGIMSVGMANRGLTVLSRVLLALALACYAVLVTITITRLIVFWPDMLAHLRDPEVSFGYFTFVAGSGVLGTALAIRGHTTAAFVFLVIATLAWVLLGYVVPWSAVIGRGQERKHERERGHSSNVSSSILPSANGTWFIWVVASQSVAVLAAAIQPEIDGLRRELAVLAVLSWSAGVFLYAAAGIFVAARMMIYRLRPRDLTPPYFVAMGATAITVVAGARIVEMADAPMVSAIRGLAAGLSLVFWAFGTWLIPALIAAGLWRHVFHRITLRYSSPLWSVVFPLGMYAVGSHYLGHADDLPLLTAIAAVEIWLAVAVWLATFAGMLRHLLRTVVLRPARPEP